MYFQPCLPLFSDDGAFSSAGILYFFGSLKCDSLIQIRQFHHYGFLTETLFWFACSIFLHFRMTIRVAWWLTGILFLMKFETPIYDREF